MKRYFFDTYALLELIWGSENYTPYYSSDNEVVTLDLNIAEAYGVLMQKGQLEIAQKLHDLFMPDALTASKLGLINGVKMKLELRKKYSKNISYVDALGYHISQSMHLEFLTGDDAFKGLKNVKFVK